MYFFTDCKLVENKSTHLVLKRYRNGQQTQQKWASTRGLVIRRSYTHPGMAAPNRKADYNKKQWG